MISTSIRIPQSTIRNQIRVIIVIPVYNHGATLRGVVKKACRLHDAVMVVDDGSTDGGWETILDLDVHRIRHSHNFGKGAAILSAAKECEKLGMTHMVTLDADGQHDPNDLHLFISAMHRSPRAIVVGKRNFETGYVPSGSALAAGFQISGYGSKPVGYLGIPRAVIAAIP